MAQEYENLCTAIICAKINPFPSAQNCNFTDSVDGHNALSKEFYSHRGVSGWLGKKRLKQSLSLGNFSVIAANPTEFLRHPTDFTPTEFLKVYPQGHLAMKL